MFNLTLSHIKLSFASRANWTPTRLNLVYKTSRTKVILRSLIFWLLIRLNVLNLSCYKIPIELSLITDRIRSMGKVMVYTCLSICSQGVCLGREGGLPLEGGESAFGGRRVCLWRGSAFGGMGWEAVYAWRNGDLHGGRGVCMGAGSAGDRTHPTGMHTCLQKFLCEQNLYLQIAFFHDRIVKFIILNITVVAVDTYFVYYLTRMPRCHESDLVPITYHVQNFELKRLK